MHSTTLKTELASKIQSNQNKICQWYSEYIKKFPPPLYCSVDLRDSEYKIAPVDCNLYPGGFNNLCPEDLRNAPQIFSSQIKSFVLEKGLEIPKRILILPEAHTLNQLYIENIYYLIQLLTRSGFIVEVGWYYTPDFQDQENIVEKHQARKPDEIVLTSHSGKKLKASPIQVKDGILSAGDFTPDAILLNNDFSSGYPKILDSIKQPILPSHTLGWHTRKKSEHFHYYNQLATEFAALIEIDPWLIKIETEEVSPVYFNEDQGLEKVEYTTKKILKYLDLSYQQHQIKQKPFVYVKNNRGTYGMGMMVVHSEEELKNLNRRTKNKMSVGKNHLPIQSVIVQEGIPTSTIMHNVYSEPVIYLVGCELIGGFLRTHDKKNAEENLNSQGMVLKKLCVSDLKTLPQIGDQELLEKVQEKIQEKPQEKIQDKLPVLELVYGSIAKISALAAGMELAQHRIQG
ncbi:MAG: glutamate--cysteine ligase [Deltaproteobacteria bacterium]|nr:glutamate--cysteine ligase [Deltaproteobacteria bacterium]